MGYSVQDAHVIIRYLNNWYRETNNILLKVWLKNRVNKIKADRGIT